MIRLIYTSKAARPITPADIHDILSTSWENNASRNITGMLCHGNDRFLQYLEGERAGVEEVYDKIKADTRHTAIILLQHEDIAERRFADWSMGYVSAKESHVMDVIKGVTGHDAFQPEDLKSDHIVDLISGLKSAIHPQFRITPDNLKD